MPISFQARVDQRLAALEARAPTFGRMRRVPIDMIATAVELEGLQLPSVSRLRRVWLWITRTSLTDLAIDKALVTVAKRNGFGPPRRTMDA